MQSIEQHLQRQEQKCPQHFSCTLPAFHYISSDDKLHQGFLPDLLAEAKSKLWVL